MFHLLVMTCVTSPTFSITINGGAHGFICGQRGLRQGYHMSPHLFLLCMEYLSKLLRLQTRDPDFKFHVKCDTNSFTHLAFADDLLLFSRGDPTLMKVLANTLGEFSETSSLKINKHKSHMFMAGVRPYEAQQIRDLFDFPLGNLPIRYLGLPLSARKLQIRHYSPLVDQIMSFINRWSNNFLSLVGRIELVRSVLQGVECYWIQMIHFSSTIIDRINRMIRQFLWGGKMSPIKLSNVCKPHKEGGLDIRDLAVWNIHWKSDSPQSILREKIFGLFLIIGVILLILIISC